MWGFEAHQSEAAIYTLNVTLSQVLKFLGFTFPTGKAGRINLVLQDWGDQSYIYKLRGMHTIKSSTMIIFKTESISRCDTLKKNPLHMQVITYINIRPALKYASLIMHWDGLSLSSYTIPRIYDGRLYLGMNKM